MCPPGRLLSRQQKRRLRAVRRAPGTATRTNSTQAGGRHDARVRTSRAGTEPPRVACAVADIQCVRRAVPLDLLAVATFDSLLPLDEQQLLQGIRQHDHSGLQNFGACRPVCLRSRHDKMPQYTLCSAVGWGGGFKPCSDSAVLCLFAIPTVFRPPPSNSLCGAGTIVQQTRLLSEQTALLSGRPRPPVYPFAWSRYRAGVGMAIFKTRARGVLANERKLRFINSTPVPGHFERLPRMKSCPSPECARPPRSP